MLEESLPMESGCSKETIIETLKKHDRLLIAFSGGVDSSLLAALAVQALGQNHVRCLLLDSPLIPRREVEEARETAAELGLPLEVLAFPILADPTFRENRTDRCYTCKKAAFRLLKVVARREGIDTIADGTNLSDLGEYRPGLAASDEEGVCHPLAVAGATKEDIRRIAFDCGLPFWNRPSAACLATRIPYGNEVTVEVLGRVEAAEDALCERGFSGVRVRVHGNLARIEVPEDKMARLFEIRREITAEFRRIGFVYVTLDLAGYRSGSMDEAI